MFKEVSRIEGRSQIKRPALGTEYDVSAMDVLNPRAYIRTLKRGAEVFRELFGSDK